MESLQPKINVHSQKEKGKLMVANRAAGTGILIPAVLLESFPLNVPAVSILGCGLFSYMLASAPLTVRCLCDSNRIYF